MISGTVQLCFFHFFLLISFLFQFSSLALYSDVVC